LTGYGAVIFFLAVLVLPETHLTPTRIHISTVGKQLISTLKHPVFVGGSLIAGMAYGLILIFNAMGPFLLQDSLKQTAVTYGYIALILGVGFFIGSIVNRLWASASPTFKIRLGAIILVILSCFFVAYAFLQPMTLWGVALPVFLFFTVTGFIYPNAMGTPMRLFPGFIGFAASFSGTIVFFVGFAMTLVASIVSTQTLLPLAGLYLLVSFLILLFYLTLFNKMKT